MATTFLEFHKEREKMWDMQFPKITYLGVEAGLPCVLACVALLIATKHYNHGQFARDRERDWGGEGACLKMRNIVCLFYTGKYLFIQLV